MQVQGRDGCETKAEHISWILAAKGREVELIMCDGRTKCGACVQRGSDAAETVVGLHRNNRRELLMAAGRTARCICQWYPSVAAVLLMTGAQTSVSMRATGTLLCGNSPSHSFS